MHIKYFQSIGNIINHYDDILFRLDDTESLMRESLLNRWGVFVSEKERILEELNVLKYLMACKYGFSHEEDIKKPSIELVNRCFNRHLYYLENVHKCNAYNVNKHHSKLIQKEYKACRHYLFKFSLEAWYKKLPDNILSFKNKYPDFEY